MPVVVLPFSFPPLFSASQLGNKVCLLTPVLHVALGGRQLVTEASAPLEQGSTSLRNPLSLIQ